MPSMPKFQPYGTTNYMQQISNLDSLGAAFDILSYKRSDRDFQERHPGIVSAEKLFEDQTLKDQSGNTELMPQVQNEFMRAGIGNTLSAFGDTGGANVLAPGSGGEASVARNLGMSVMGFQQQNRANRTNSLLTSEQIFPRRSIGLSGADAVQLAMLNEQGQNNWNQADYSNRLQVAQSQYNANIQQQNAGAAAGASKSSALIGGGAAIAGGVLIAL